MTDDKSNPDFWRDIKPGSTITLTDEQAIADSMERGLGVNGMDYLVDSVWKIRQEDGLAEWIIFRLDDSDQEVMLVVKIVGSDAGVSIYFIPDEFEPGNRQDVVERGDNWLFREPEDIDKFSFDELEYIDEIEWIVETEDGEIEIIYRLKGQGVQYGEVRMEPVSGGLAGILASVAEYKTAQDYENPDLMILELGGEKGDEGGLISLMVGCPVNLGEIDVLKSVKETPEKLRKPSIWERTLRKIGG